MDEQTYLRESARTVSHAYHAERVPPQELDMMLQAVITASQWADRVKRALFYGSDIKLRASYGTATSVKHDDELGDFVHGVIGKITETGEMAEHLLDVLRGEKPLDPVNVTEEIGDDSWYNALLHRFFGTLPSEAYAKNIAKLTKRYPDKFTLEAAENRDLVAERAVLEGGA